MFCDGASVVLDADLLSPDSADGSLCCDVWSSRRWETKRWRRVRTAASLKPGVNAALMGRRRTQSKWSVNGEKVVEP